LKMYCKAGALVFERLGLRPFRTSWLIVGIVILQTISGYTPQIMSRKRRPSDVHDGLA
jgi:hypothetical protein